MLPGFCAAEPRNDPRRKLERLYGENDINDRVLKGILLFYALSCSHLPIRSCSAVCQIAIPGVIRIQTRLLYNQLIYIITRRFKTNLQGSTLHCQRMTLWYTAQGHRMVIMGQGLQLLVVVLIVVGVVE